MSVAGMLDAMRSDRKLSERMVWMCLENHANGGREWTITIDRIASELHINPSTVISAIRELKKDKVLDVTKILRTSSTYKMLRTYSCKAKTDIGNSESKEPEPDLFTLEIHPKVTLEIPTLNPPSKYNPPEVDSVPDGDAAPAAPERDVHVRDVVEAWNDMAPDAGLATVRGKLAPDRRKRLSARLAEHGVEGMLEAVAMVRRSQFLRGLGGRGWKANFDFILSPQSCRKVLDGVYDHLVQSSKPDPWAATMARLIPEPMR